MAPALALDSNGLAALERQHVGSGQGRGDDGQRQRHDKRQQANWSSPQAAEREIVGYFDY